MSIDTARQKLVHNKFIERWVTRYGDICAKHGAEQGRLWANTFLNKDDSERIVEEMKNRGPT